MLRTCTADIEFCGETSSEGSGIVHPSQTPKLLHRLHGRVSSQRARLFLQAVHAAAALFPEATRLAVRIALMKDLRSFKAIIGTVLYVFTGCIVLTFPLSPLRSGHDPIISFDVNEPSSFRQQGVNGMQVPYVRAKEFGPTGATTG